MIGNGSYGCVSQGKCKTTGRIVAMKIMKSEAVMEYEIIKLLREVQIMRRLNHISNKYFGSGAHPFIPELIDIITPSSNFKGMTTSKSLTSNSIQTVMNAEKQEMDLS